MTPSWNCDHLRRPRIRTTYHPSSVARDILDKMLAQIPNHPPPSYLDRDPDVVSLRSAAPSYTSSIPPAYTQASTAAAASAATVASASHQHQQRRLAAYTSLIPPGSSAADVATAGADPIPAHHHAYTVASWPSLSNQSQSRAYLNVAARRARRAQEQAAGTDVRRAVRLLEGCSLSGSGSSSSAGGSGGSGSATPAEEAALHTESRAWDFFTAQISDWDRREVSWRAFRARHQSVVNGGRGGRPKDKGKPRARWGLYGRLG